MSAVFRFVDGDFAQYRGHVFLYGKPTRIDDMATVNALKRHPAFEEVTDEVDEAPQRQVENTAEAEILNKNACPKCGRIVTHGKYLHQKYCQGSP